MIRWVVLSRELRVGDAAAKAILVDLADRANEAGECFPSIKRIAYDTELAESTVKTKLRFLIEQGFITKGPRAAQSGRTKSNLYCLVLDQLDEGGGAESRPLGAESRPPEGACVAPREGAGAAPPTTSEPKEKNLISAEPRKEKVPNIVWDALVESFGAPATRSETTDFGKTVSEIRSVIPSGATLEQVREAVRGRVRRWDRMHPDIPCTHRVLRNKWGELGGGLREVIREAAGMLPPPFDAALSAESFADESGWVAYCAANDLDGHGRPLEGGTF